MRTESSSLLRDNGDTKKFIIKKARFSGAFYISAEKIRSYHAIGSISAKLLYLCFYFICSLIYSKKVCCMPAPRKHNISRNLWRFLEISLFFLVSVLGYNFLAKTSSFNAKSKSKEHSSRVAVVQNFFDESVSALCSCHERSPACLSLHSKTSFYAVFYHGPDRSSYIDTTPALLHTTSIFPFTVNLFQQNQVLIM